MPGTNKTHSSLLMFVRYTLAVDKCWERSQTVQPRSPKLFTLLQSSQPLKT